jgi:hypothetical protein
LRCCNVLAITNGVGNIRNKHWPSTEFIPQSFLRYPALERSRWHVTEITNAPWNVHGFKHYSYSLFKKVCFEELISFEASSNQER